MNDAGHPWIHIPLKFIGGSVRTTDLEGSVRASILLLIQNYVQGWAKPGGVAAIDEFGADLPHHTFGADGGKIDIAIPLKSSIVKNEVRVRERGLRVVFDRESKPGRRLPHRTIIVSGILTEDDTPFEFEYEVEDPA